MNTFQDLFDRQKRYFATGAPRTYVAGDPHDLAALRKGMEIGRELGNSAAMKPFVKREIRPRRRQSLPAFNSKRSTTNVNESNQIGD